MNSRIGVLLSLTMSALAMAASAARGEVDEGQARHVPWSGYWFPIAKGELLEPLRKYDALTGSNAYGWEMNKNPPGAGQPGWHGYCHGWAAASVLEEEPAQQRMAQSAGGNVMLGVGDQKGWYAASHSGDAANWFGDRFGDGKGNEDPSDMRPDMLWQLLKLFLKDQRVPLIMDLDAGPEVWNYPVYAYRIEYQPHPSGNGWHSAQLSLWAADDAVPPDYVGVVPHFQTYTFQFQARGRAVVAGSAAWTGQSVQDHPDFAWYPYVVRSDNPELQYAVVKQLITGVAATGSPGLPQSPSGGLAPGGLAAGGGSFGQPGGGGLPFGTPGVSTPGYGKPPSGGAASSLPFNPLPGQGGSPSPFEKPRTGSAPPTAPHIPPTAPSVPLASAPAPTPFVPQFSTAPQPNTTPYTPNFSVPAGQPALGGPPASAPYIPGFSPPNAQPAPAGQPAPTPLSPMQMVTAVINRTSRFELDIHAAQFGKIQYAIGDAVQLAGTASEDGYLYLLHIDPQGELSLIFPRRMGDDNRVAANTKFSFPPAGDFVAAGPPGNHFVKAIVTRQPLMLTGLTHELPPEANPGPPREANVGRGQGRFLRLCPTQIKAITSVLHDYVQGKSINSRDLVGEFAPALPEFAQDEFVYYVGPGN